MKIIRELAVECMRAEMCVAMGEHTTRTANKKWQKRVSLNIFRK